MLEAKDIKVGGAAVKSIPADREGLLTSWVTQSSDLAERGTHTFYGIVRDARGELNERVLGTLAFIEGTQASFFKLARRINERVQQLGDDTIDAAENLTLGAIRSVRDVGKGVTGLASSFTKPRESTNGAQ
jgi:hypothetical protein